MTKKTLVFLLYACSLSALAALDPAQVNQLVLAEGDLATVQNDQRVIEVYLGR